MSSIPRITARIDSDTRALLNEAATLSGSPSINAFVLSSAVEKARALIRENETVRLDAEATQKLLDALDNPPAPNAKLAALFARHANRNT